MGLSELSTDDGGGKFGVIRVFRGGIDDLDDLKEMAVGLSTMIAAEAGCKLNLGFSKGEGCGTSGRGFDVDSEMIEIGGVWLSSVGVAGSGLSVSSTVSRCFEG
jgi:hypothetical protein